MFAPAAAAAAVGDAPIIATDVVPVTVTLNIPDCEAWVVEVPRYCALTECVPTMGRNIGALAAVTVMLPVAPLVTGAKPVIPIPSTKNWTFPVGVPPLTVALRVSEPFAANFVLETVS